MTEELLSPVEKVYRSAKKTKAKYAKKNPEKLKKYHYKYLSKLKTDPKRYEKYREKRQLYNKKYKEKQLQSIISE